VLLESTERRISHMSTVAQREGVGQEEKDERKVEEYLRGIEAERFWEELALQVRVGAAALRIFPNSSD